MGIDRDALQRVRREPPPFRRVAVLRLEHLTPRMTRVVLGGPELDGLHVDEPAASVRILLPRPGEREIVMPSWTGNQFELPGGERAPIRTFTPRDLDTGDEDRHPELSVDVVVHEHGAAVGWLRATRPGDEVAVSGPGRGEQIDVDVASYLLAGDETAIPAMGQLLEALPDEMAVRMHVEIAMPDARLDLPDHPGADVTWHLAEPGAAPGAGFVAAIEAADELPERIWVAGEAAAVQRVRRHLFDARGLPRSVVTARGYWKLGRSAT
jgi:NADPH-dependent ferric siderophore reductase